MEQARYAAGDKRKGKLRVFLVHFGLSASRKETKKKRDLMGKEWVEEWNHFAAVQQKCRMNKNKHRANKVNCLVPEQIEPSPTPRILLKEFAFLLCFVLYVYVMIFQFGIKHKVLCERTCPSWEEPRWRSSSDELRRQPAPNRDIIQEHKSNIAFTPFSPILQI